MNIVFCSKKNIISEGVCARLKTDGDLRSFVHVESVREVIDICAEIRPPVVIMNTDLLEMQNIKNFVSDVNAASPDSGVLVMSSLKTKFAAFEIVAAGAMGMLDPSESSGSELLVAVDSIANKHFYIGKSTEDHILADSKVIFNQINNHNLQDREIEVLVLLSNGKSSKKIGQILGIATSTVDVHRRNIMSKTGLHNIADLTRFAIRNLNVVA